MNNYITESEFCQEVYINQGELFDKGGKRERPWKRQKALSEKVAEHYRTFDNDKADRMSACADFLVFNKAEGGLKLKTANFCRVRLCPMCQWRRALKVYGQMSRICEKIDWDKYALLSVVMTVQNCQPERLSETIDMMMTGYNRFMKYKAVDRMCKGAYRACEITISKRADSWFGTLHPHFHVLMLVQKSYFKSRDYISAEKMTEMWAKACKLDYMPDMSVKRVYVRDGQTITEALKEVCKYTLKDSQLTQDRHIDADRYFALLETQMQGRRFVGLSGLFKDLHKELNLSAIDDDSDLIGATELDDKAAEEVVFVWKSGAYYMEVRG